MQILSVSECPATQASADGLCGLVSQHADALRDASMGRRFTLDRARFRLLKNDRNVLYKIDFGRRWYLKMPRVQSSSAIAQEIYGAQIVRSALADESRYQHPSCQRACPKIGYVLTSEIRGKQLNHALYRSLLAGQLFTSLNISDSFRTLGRVLAQLHRVQADECAPIDRTVINMVKGQLRGASQRDATCDKIEAFVHEISRPAPTSFSHGNLGLINVLAYGDRISIIDFECCGRSSIYDDLSLICGTLALAGVAPHLNSVRITKAMHCFLEGYQIINSIDDEILDRHIALRVAQSYIYWFCCNRGRMRIAGWPIGASRIRTHLNRLMENQHIGQSRNSCAAIETA